MKNKLTLLLIFVTTFCLGQSGAKFASGGNTLSTGDFLGTTNNYPLDIKTNNTYRGGFSATGVFKISNLTGTGSRLLQTDASGNIIFLPTGTSAQFLRGDGTWAVVPTPTVAPNPWIQTGSNLYTLATKVGIGTTTPLFPLDVIGDTRISNNLFVGGGIIITDQVNANTQVNSYNIQVSNDLTVEANSRFKGQTILEKGFTFDGINGITYTTTSSGGGVLRIGTLGPLPTLPTTCIPSLTGVTTFMGRTGVIKTGSQNVLDINNDGTDGFIDYGYDISVHPYGSPSAPKLKINSFCSGDVEIAKGGGVVSTGNYFEVGNPIRNGVIASNILATSGRIGQRITTSSPFPISYPNPPATYNTQLFVNRDFIHAFSIFNTATNPSGDELFTVYGNGKTVIGLQKLNTGPHTNAMLTVDGKMIAKSCYITLNDWADYVFDKDYKLPTLVEIETYYKANKHLPEIPTEKEVIENGVNIAEMNKLLLKKVEELTLYLVQQQKDIEILKAKVK